MTIRDYIAANPTSTDEQLLALCASNPCTVRPIVLADLRPLLAGKGILGRLLMASAASVDAANAYAYINSANVTIASHEPAYAAQLEAMLGGLTMLGLNEQDRADIIALGGGYTVRGVTVEQIAAERSAMARETAITQLHSVLDSVRTAAEVAANESMDRAAIRAAMIAAFDAGWGE